MSEVKKTRGCENYDSSTGICEMMFLNSDSLPSEAKQEEIHNPQVIVGDYAPIIGLICQAKNNLLRQESCSHTTPRSENKDDLDFNW